ncbi:hypothetical protein GQ43DRAFT_346279, partial [Delitschia confertaspora ATCC 74209]
PTLLTLPLEIRHLIYEALFSTYIIHHGFPSPVPPPFPSSRSNIVLAQNRTALLRTNHQLHTEATPFLPVQAALHFRHTESLLTTLLPLPQPTLTRLRHLRVTGFPFPLYGDGKTEFYTAYSFCNALSLLPGLCLERLVVEDAFHRFGLGEGWRDLATYFEIENLMECEGWRVCEFVVSGTGFLTGLGGGGRRRRRSQPENWDRLLKERDGNESGAGVEMFICPGKKVGPDGKGVDGEGEMRPWSSRPGTELLDEGVLDPQTDIEGEVHVIARRGRRVSCAVTGLREVTTWKEMKEKGIKKNDWKPYHNDMEDAVGWIYGGWGRRMQLALSAL